MGKGEAEAVVAAAFRRSPARNRYVDAERWPVFTREQLGADGQVMVEAEGMVESQEWHRAPGKADYYDAAPSARGERAILIQSASHIAQLAEQSHPRLARYALRAARRLSSLRSRGARQCQWWHSLL